MTYTINGLTVDFTAEQAEAWNCGDYDRDTVRVYAPVTRCGMGESEWQEWPADDELLDSFACDCEADEIDSLLTEIDAMDVE